MFDPVVLYQDDTWRITKISSPVTPTKLVVEVRRHDALRAPFWSEKDTCYVNGEYATLNVPPPILMKILEFWKQQEPWRR